MGPDEEALMGPDEVALMGTDEVALMGTDEVALIGCTDEAPLISGTDGHCIEAVNSSFAAILCLVCTSCRQKLSHL